MRAEAEILDYIEDPQEEGYRGVHLRTRYRVPDNSHGVTLPVHDVTIPVEVQVRTFLQDAWARLTHRDIYKHGEELPKNLRGRSQDLAEMLSSADDIAKRIRARLTEERVPP